MQSSAFHEVIAEPATEGRFVELPLIYELGAAGVVAEDLIVEVQAGDDCAQSVVDAIGSLSVHLEVRQGVDVTGWSLGAEAAGVLADDKSRRNIVVAEEAAAVIGKAHAKREPLGVVGGAEIEGVCSLVDQSGMIAA